MSTERADYLDTQTLSGGDGYFHTENDATHATDGTATNQSPETPLVTASREGAAAEPGDGLDDLTNAELAGMAEAQGIDVPARANKAQLLAALRGE
jgi:hypothetical protein